MDSTTTRRAFIGRSAILAGSSLLTSALGASPAPSDPFRSAVPLDGLVSLGDAESAATSILPAAFRDFLQGGAGDEVTLRWNQERFREIRLRPRVLTDLGTLNTETTLFGTTMPSPVLFAPTSSNRVFHPEGELAVARGANATNTTYVLSTLSNTAVEDVARATQSPLWFQVYVQLDLELTKDLMRRAEAAGARVLVLTVDAPVPGARSREERARFRLPAELSLPHIAKRRPPGQFTLDRIIPIKLVWSDVEELIRFAKVPVVLKGILTGADATIALKSGAAGIIVSNHGARQLDTLPATIDALPEIADAVGGRVPLLLDGGIRRGTDVIKAIALGADAVLIGRPYLHGLATHGADGVAHIQRLLLRELRMAMALLGCSSVAAIDQSVLWDRRPH